MFMVRAGHSLAVVARGRDPYGSEVSARGEACPIVTGHAWAFGLGVTAELIVPRAHWGDASPGPHLMTAVDPSFPKRIDPGDILIGGQDFGAGSVDDTPVRAIRDAGAGAVVAYSFDATFTGFAVDCGLPAVAVNEALAIHTGARLRIDLEGYRVVNLSSGDRYPIRNLSDAVLERYRASLVR
jgi:3-isopropylmalate/(R)-2-methylmalate dehydratase small subunit